MAVTARDAATVMLVRDARDDSGTPGVEVCMLRRNLASEFVAGAYVFPGGAVDPTDHSAEAIGICRGRTDAEASKILGIASGGLGFWVAALRECFEESGVLVARYERDGVAGALLDTGDPPVARRFEQHRLDLLEGRTTFAAICREEGLVLAVDEIDYISHWITPEVAPRRYDTRFFITTAPAGQIARHDDGETIASVWVRPSEALERHAAGETVLLPPTVSNLTSVATCETAAAAMSWAGGVTEVPTILPIVLVEDGNLVILRPGDAGYREALEDRLASGGPTGLQISDADRATWGHELGIV